MERIFLILLVILLIPGVLYTTRYFCLKKSLKKGKEELEEILGDFDSNRIIKCTCPDKELESLFQIVNAFILQSKKERIKYLRRETEIRKEIENISHDLRTPLTSIRGYLELMDESKLKEEEILYLDVVKRKSSVLQKMIGSFYDLSRLEAGEYAFAMEKLELNRMITELMFDHFYDFESRQIQVKLELGTDPIFIYGDRQAIERVFSNLLQNALKYAETYFYTSAQISLEKQSVKFYFQNDAQVSDYDLEHLFDRFYLGDDSRSNQSSGLGLTIAKLLVEKMNGEIEVHRIKNYLEFVLEFPVILEAHFA